MDSCFKKKCAFVYSGIGTQWKTMGVDLLHEYPVFSNALENCDKEFAEFSNWSIIEELKRPAEKSRIDDLLTAHPCNVAIQIGLSELFKSWGIVPQGVVGHSSGEVAASNIAGILSVKEAMHLTWQHCRLMSHIINKGVLAHISLPEAEVRNILKNEISNSLIWVSAINSPSAAVVTGAEDVLTPLVNRLKEQQIFCRILRINIPYHSPVVEPFLSDFQNSITSIKSEKNKNSADNKENPADNKNINTAATDAQTFLNPIIPIYSSLRGGKPFDGDFLQAGYWADHISKPVHFADAVKVMLSDGYTTFIEISPHGVLSGAVEECAKNNPLPVTAVSTLKRFSDSNAAITDALAQLAAEDNLDLNITTLPEKIKKNVKDKVHSIIKNRIKQHRDSDNSEKNIEELIKEAVISVTHGAITPHSDNLAGFLEMGLTSQHAVRMANYLSNALGFRVSAALMFDYPNIASLTAFLTNNIKKENIDNSVALLKNKHLQNNYLTQDNRNIKEMEIAIIGMGCRFPDSVNNPSQFHKLLLDGRCVIKPVPSSRWNSKFWHDPNPDVIGKAYTQAGGFLDDSNIFNFDSQFFRIPPKEALALDPQQRLLLETIWEAFENGGILPSDYSGKRVGVYVGLSTADYMGSHLWSSNSESIDAYSATGSMYCAAAGRISYIFNLQGPNFSVDTACSSSLTALDCACKALRAGVISSAIAAGVNVMVHPHLFVYFSKLGALSPSGQCRTFDAAADGYVRGEGAGAVLLKPLDQALADGDRIFAVIKGIALNHDGASSSFTAPNGTAQQRVIRSALEDAGISHLDVDYVEAHGTGTRLGDPIEIEALGAVYGENRPKDRPLLVGSVKANIGHLEAGAGMAGIIKTVLTLNSRIIPPQVGFETPNPLISWEDLPIEIPREKRIFQDNKKSGDNIGTNNKPFIAGISAFGFSGTNAHLILAEPPNKILDNKLISINTQTNTPTKYKLAISAKTQDALIAYCVDYIDFIQQIDDEPQSLHKTLIDMCYTAEVGRTLFEHKLSVTGNNKEDLINSLKRIIDGQESYSYISEIPEQIMSAGSRISIPTYPFQRKRFWRNPVSNSTETASIERLSKAGHESLKYKNNTSILPGKRIFLPPISQHFRDTVDYNEQNIELYHSEVNPKYPLFIPEHIIYGEPIVPAAAYLSYLFSYFKIKNLKNISAVDIRFTAPMIVHELRTVQFLSFNDSDSKGINSDRTDSNGINSDETDLDGTDSQSSKTNFKIISRTDNSSWITHCEGGLELVDKRNNPQNEFNDNSFIIWKDSSFNNRLDEFCKNSEQIITGNDFYSKFNTLGYNLGDGFCRIEKAYCNTNKDGADKELSLLNTKSKLNIESNYDSGTVKPLPDALSILNLESADKSFTSDYDLYPGFIDAMLQSLVFGKPQIIEAMTLHSKILIPFALERFEIYGLPTFGSKVVSIVNTRQETDYIQGDIRIFTPDGVPLLSFLGLTVKLTDKSTLLKNLKGSTKNNLKYEPSKLDQLPKFYNIYWKESEESGISNFNKNDNIYFKTRSEKILIFSDQAGIGSKICERLESMGFKCQIILRENFNYELPHLGELDPNKSFKIIYLYGCDLKFNEDKSNQDVSKIHQKQIDSLYYAQLILKTFAESGSQFKFYGITCSAFTIKSAFKIKDDSLAINSNAAAHSNRAAHTNAASHAVQQSIWGFCKTAALEYPQYFGGCIDLDFAQEVDFNQTCLSKTHLSQIDYFISDFISKDYLDMRAYRINRTDNIEHQVQVKLFYPHIKPIDLSNTSTSTANTNDIRMSDIDKTGFVLDYSTTSTKPPYKLNLNGAYLITGASGGLGLPVVRKMVELGARELWLLVRREPNPQFLKSVQELREKNIEIKLIQADLSDAEKLNGGLARLSCDLSTLKGVIHLAGIRQDALLPLQTYQSFTAAIESKAIGAWNLHNLVKELELDFFILFSSAASMLGSQGQANYSAANAFLDGLADYRCSLGLPALSIQWGPWAQSGMAASESAVLENLTNLGFSYISQEQGLKAFEAFLNVPFSTFFNSEADKLFEADSFDSPTVRQLTPSPFNSPTVGVFDCRWSAYLEHTGQEKVSLFKYLISTIKKEPDGNDDNKHDTNKTPELWLELDNLTQDQRHRILLKHLADSAEKVSGFAVKSDIALMEQGFDSLMAVEFRNQLQKICGFPLPVTLLFTYPNLSDIAAFLEKRQYSDTVPYSKSKVGQDNSNVKNITNAVKSDEPENPNSGEYQSYQLEQSQFEAVQIDTDADFTYLDNLTPEELNELISNDLKDILE